MMIFPLVFSAFIGLVLFFDHLLLKQVKSRAYRLLTLIFFSAVFLSIYQKPLYWLAHSLKVGRPVDLVIYFVVVILLRELCLSRIKHVELKEEITTLVRAMAIRDAQELSNPKEGKEGKE